MKPSEIPLETHLKRLHLANAPRIYRELAERAEREQWSYQDFLTVLVGEEIAHRQQTRLQRLVRRARFPFLKTIDEFDFTYQSVLRLALLGSYLSADFVTEGRCLILSGKSGRGKTHLAVALAYRAIQNGFDALFTTAAALIDELSRASREGRLLEALAAYTHPHVLVIDEVGYLAYGADAANVLFHVVNDRHLHRRSMIFTTNKPLDAWGRVLHDPDLAAAIVDRVLERGRLLPLDGPSLRTRHLGLDDPTAEGVSTQPVRISGTDLSEYPEPTRFERYRWSPTPGGPVWSGLGIVPGGTFVAGANDLLLGHVIGTKVPIYLDCVAACDGHVAILGMTKMGKSTLAERLARMLARSRRVTVLDQTGEYVSKKGFPVCDKDVDWRTPGIAVFEPKPGEVPAKRAHDFLDYLVKQALDEYKVGTPIPRSVIIDEAHQFVPEPAGLGFGAPGREDSYAIGLLMMQIRKYGISIVLISQRTAVVAKSALSQCENLIAFRSVDQTGLDYLEAIAGGDVRNFLPQLRQGEALVFGPALSTDSPVGIQVAMPETPVEVRAKEA